MRCVILFALFLATLAAAAPRWNELEGYTFKHYVADFGRQYAGEEYTKRERLFNANLDEIRAHNADKTQTYKKGVNQFSDWSADEWRDYNGARPHKYKAPQPTSVYKADPSEPLPSMVDWRLQNPSVLTAIKNQGACGNCWATSAAESMESQFALLTGQLPVLSQQQITSCTDLAMGCGGGMYTTAWFSFEFSKGVNEEWLYPFVDFFPKADTKGATAPCEDITKKFLPNFAWYPKAAVTGFELVTPNDAQSAMSALHKHGPQSIAVAASLWMNYEGGIYSNNGTNPANWEIDHAVQLVGYGHDFDSNQDYWIVRNSWGTTWGEDGYIRLARPKVEPCGTYNFVEKVCGTSGLLYMPARPNVKELKKLNP